jgi:hypothetical protein
MSANVQRIISQIMALSPEEQASLRGLLANGTPTPIVPSKEGTEEDEDRLEQELLAEGTLDYVPPKITDFTPWENRTPATIVGISASEFLISERR